MQVKSKWTFTAKEPECKLGTTGQATRNSGRVLVRIQFYFKRTFTALMPASTLGTMG
jgi:hypothetical protein